MKESLGRSDEQTSYSKSAATTKVHMSLAAKHIAQPHFTIQYVKSLQATADELDTLNCRESLE